MRRICLAAVLILSLPFAPLATGAQQPRGADSRPFKPEELEHIVAPIALYPDPLVAQIFKASTYPLEVIQAARFAKANPGLKGNVLNEALKDYKWDDSVKALVSSPQVLERMDSQLEWMLLPRCRSLASRSRPPAPFLGPNSADPRNSLPLRHSATRRKGRDC
jgi:Protein of unknown function (DUF3300)